MRRSTDRILVSHAGTLPRPDDVAVEGARLATKHLWGR